MYAKCTIKVTKELKINKLNTQNKVKVKVKQSRYRPGVAQRVPES
jgi:hypothetical protein